MYDYGTSLAQAGGNAQSAAFGGFGGYGGFGGLAAGQAAGGSQALASGGPYGIPSADYWSTLMAQSAGPMAAQSKFMSLNSRVV